MVGFLVDTTVVELADLQLMLGRVIISCNTNLG